MVEVSGIDPWNAVVSGSWMHGGVRSNETFPLVLQPEHEFSLREYVPDCGVQVVGTKNLVHFQGKISSTAVPDGLCLHLDIESESGHPASAPRGSGACFKVKRKDIARSFLERAESLSVREDIKIEAKYACAADSKCVGFVAAILTATPKSFAHPVSCGGDLALWSDFARWAHRRRKTCFELFWIVLTSFVNRFDRRSRSIIGAVLLAGTTTLATPQA